MEPQPQAVQIILPLLEDPVPHRAVSLLHLQARQVWTQKFLYLGNGHWLPEPPDSRQGLPASLQKAAGFCSVKTTPQFPSPLTLPQQLQTGELALVSGQAAPTPETPPYQWPRPHVLLPTHRHALLLGSSPHPSLPNGPAPLEAIPARPLSAAF